MSKREIPGAKSLTIGMGLILIFSVLLSACQPAPAPTEPPAPPTPPPAASPTPEPAPTDTAAPTPEPTADLSLQLADTQWLLVAFGEAANPAVVEKGTAVTALFASDG
ncbi:MAG: hypothetical protein IT316_07880, partial [Anaerolineales bacterium]|nr:hypothetical protein [Anaerolineales bacterium]